MTKGQSIAQHSPLTPLPSLPGYVLHMFVVTVGALNRPAIPAHRGRILVFDKYDEGQKMGNGEAVLRLPKRDRHTAG